jgi:chemotaxis protein histidine kinase CheA/ActR/RegA family two-component response regulator
MTTPGRSSNSSNQFAADEAEIQLQQELRAMFAVDTQQHLETYFTLVQQMSAQSWATDIQHLYRAVHTVKGGAVTVDADAMLHAAMVLEDLLSDLRYLEQAPALEDGKLGRILLEAGELLSSSIDITETGDQATLRVQPTVARLLSLREQVKERYIPDWSELKQVHQEFAEQGFDLVILDLEMALGTLSSPTSSSPLQNARQSTVPVVVVESAQQTVAQLIQIGQDLQFAEGWAALIQQCEALIHQPSIPLWQRGWPARFDILKACAKEGGKLTPEIQTQLQSLEQVALDFGLGSGLDSVNLDSVNLDFAGLGFAGLGSVIPADLDFAGLNSAIPADPDFVDSDFAEFGSATPADPSADLFTFSSSEHLGTLKDLSRLESASALDSDMPLDTFGDLGDFGDFGDLSGLDALDALSVLEDLEDLDALVSQDTLRELSALETLEASSFAEIQNELELAKPEHSEPERSEPEHSEPEHSELLLRDVVFNGVVFNENEVDHEADPGAIPQIELGLFPQNEPAAPSVSEEIPVAIPESFEHRRDVQIPVPLERLDQSAKQVVTTLLSARSVMNSSQKLQTQMMQLTALTQESAQFVTRLRQLQDDYALLRNLSDEQETSNNLTLERYRQGYSTINRLLENILRMSELGQEIETVTQQAVTRLDQLDRSILQLKDGIETSRLIPFRNLALRSKAILRDLTNRYGKPAELLVTGEQVELDAGIVQQLEPLLLHLLRNAYDHGLEPAEERLANGKPIQSVIILSLQRRGNVYRLTLSDDGRGIDAAVVAQQAKAKGFALTQTRTASELLAVLCQPGFSSRSSVSEVSGRGVGMDVVAAQVAAMGGKLSLQTQVGQGTSFMLEIPAPQLLVPCVMLQVGGRTLALPTEEILETVLLCTVQVQPANDATSLCTWSVTTVQGTGQGFDLSEYWSYASQSVAGGTGRSLPDTAICIRTRQESGAKASLWLIADDLLGQEDLLINPLPSPLIAPEGLLGVSLQPDGSLISILDPVALAEMVQSAKAPEVAVSEPVAVRDGSVRDGASSQRTILVVDDAALMRRRMEGSLNTYGFVTHTCGDGAEALSWLQTHPLPDLMITDVEMPNMDGFTLIDRCRQSGIEIPILVVSSRLSEEWGKEAQRLGATDYLNKGFSTAELMQKINQCLDGIEVPVP